MRPRSARPACGRRKPFARCGRGSQPALPEIARALALLKFCLIGVALVYVALGTIIRALRLIIRR